MNKEQTKPWDPGPFWKWLVAAVVFAQIIKYSFLTLAPQSEVGVVNDFTANFFWNSLLGLPVVIPYFILKARAIQADKPKPDVPEGAIIVPPSVLIGLLLVAAIVVAILMMS